MESVNDFVMSYTLLHTPSYGLQSSRSATSGNMQQVCDIMMIVEQSLAYDLSKALKWIFNDFIGTVHIMYIRLFHKQSHVQNSLKKNLRNYAGLKKL